MAKEESIYNIIPRPLPKHAKPERYQSKFRESVKEEKKINKTECKTMGPPKVAPNDPDSFMKKRSKLPDMSEKKDFKYPDEDQRKPSVPKRSDVPIMGAKSNKNFIESNAVQNIMSVPKRPACNFVDAKDGSIHLLEPSGLTPRFIKKRDYGKTPTYLVKRKEALENAQDEYESYVQNSLQRGAMKCLPESERQNLLAGLKSNWEDLQHQYQGLSVVTDTTSKKNRKERMEAEMNELEREIECLEKHTKIYIVTGKDD